MATIRQKNGIFHVRFRYGQRAYKKSLRTRESADAEAAKNLVEFTLFRLKTGQLQVPEGVDAGDFVVSGGTLSPPPEEQQSPPRISLRELVDQYRADQDHKADTTRYTEQVHLNNLLNWLDGAPD